MTRQVQRQAQEARTLGETSSFQELICQHCQEVVQDSTYQLWQAHSDEVRTSCREEHRKTDLVEGQFQFSMRSHQKEGTV